MYIFNNPLGRQDHKSQEDNDFNTLPYFHWEKCLDDPVLLQYLDQIPAEWEQATVGDNEVMPKIRKHTQKSIPHNIASHALYEALLKPIESVNYYHYNFLLWSMETIQYAKFEQGDMYVMHNDRTAMKDRSERKMTAIFALSDAEEFKGGKIVLTPSGYPKHKVEILLNKGDMLVFPTWVPYEMKPVEEGTSKFLLTWMYGPKFV